MAYRTRRGESQFQARTRLARAQGFGSYREQRKANPAARARARAHLPDLSNMAWSVMAAMHLGLDEDEAWIRWLSLGGTDAQQPTYADTWAAVERLTDDDERAEWWRLGYRLRAPAHRAKRWRRGPRRVRWGIRVEVWIQDQLGRFDRHQYIHYTHTLGTARTACLAGIDEYEEARAQDPTKYGPTRGAIPVAIYRITRS